MRVNAVDERTQEVVGRWLVLVESEEARVTKSLTVELFSGQGDIQSFAF